jgi:hypothetical protein
MLHQNIEGTRGEPSALYKQKWDELLKSKPIPRYLRSTIRMPYAEFRDKILNSQGFVDEFVDSIYGGDFWLVQGAFTAADMEQVKRSVLAFQATQQPSNPKVVEGCPNYHAIVDGSTAPKGGYVAIDHSSFFYRWNGDSHGLFKTFDEVWKLMKIVSGRTPDEYVANTPKDLFVDRIQIIQYPPGGGQITPHGDPYVTMKLNLGVFMSTYGTDFKQGGFYIADRPDHPVYLDHDARPGDMPIWFSYLVHSVEAVDPGQAIDWKTTGGRWYVHLNTVESAYVEKRHSGVPLR